jgi:FixJ family two-component response regulator
MPAPGAPIFVIDDDEAVRDSLQLLLAAEGFQAVGFGSGTAALAEIERARPACLVVDLHMPVVSGLELIGALAARDIRLPVVMISGRVDRRIRQRAVAAGVHVVLEKPFADAQLLEAISQARLAGAGLADIRTIPNSRCGPTAR